MVLATVPVQEAVEQADWQAGPEYGADCVGPPLLSKFAQ